MALPNPEHRPSIAMPLSQAVLVLIWLMPLSQAVLVLIWLVLSQAVLVLIWLVEVMIPDVPQASPRPRLGSSQG